MTMIHTNYYIILWKKNNYMIVLSSYSCKGPFSVTETAQRKRTLNYDYQWKENGLGDQVGSGYVVLFNFHSESVRNFEKYNSAVSGSLLLLFFNNWNVLRN